MCLCNRKTSKSLPLLPPKNVEGDDLKGKWDKRKCAWAKKCPKVSQRQSIAQKRVHAHPLTAREREHWFFAAFEPFHICDFRVSIVRTPFCAILWRSPTKSALGVLLCTWIGVPQSVLRGVLFGSVVGLLNARRQHSLGHSEPGAQKHFESTLWGALALSGPGPRALLLMAAGIASLNVRLKPTLLSNAQYSEEDKRATTNVENGLVFFFLFSFILFYSL